MEITTFKEWVWTESFESKLEHLYGPEQIEKQRIRFYTCLVASKKSFLNHRILMYLVHLVVLKSVEIIPIIN